MTAKKFAHIVDGAIVDTIRADDAFVPAHPLDWVECPEEYGIGHLYDAITMAFSYPPVTPPPVVPDPCAWLIDQGPFADRLGSKTFAVDTSTVPGVIAVSKDLARRKWIDLKDLRVAGGLYYLAGHATPVLGTLAPAILTDAEVVAILTTPVTDAENRALRKVYFS